MGRRVSPRSDTNDDNDEQFQALLDEIKPNWPRDDKDDDG